MTTRKSDARDDIAAILKLEEFLRKLSKMEDFFKKFLFSNILQICSTESEQEDREDTESDHSIRPVTEREQEDRDEIESDQFIQASPHDSGWVIG